MNATSASNSLLHTDLRVLMKSAMASGIRGIREAYRAFQGARPAAVTSQPACVVTPSGWPQDSVQELAEILRDKAGKGIRVQGFFYNNGRWWVSAWLPSHLAQRKNGGRLYLKIAEGDSRNGATKKEIVRKCINDLRERLGLNTEPRKPKEDSVAVRSHVPAAVEPATASAPVAVSGDLVIDEVVGVLIAHGMGSHPDGNGGSYQCYFADVETPRGIQRKLGHDLRRALIQAQATMGDTVSMVRTTVPVNVPGKSEAHKNLWTIKTVVKAPEA